MPNHRNLYILLATSTSKTGKLQLTPLVYQIDNDISLLKNHIDDIGRVIFKSKLAITPTGLPGEKEIKIVDNFETYTKTKVSVSFHEEQIIIILSDPVFSTQSFSQITFESIYNSNN